MYSGNKQYEREQTMRSVEKVRMGRALLLDVFIINTVQQVSPARITDTKSPHKTYTNKGSGELQRL